MRALFDTKNLGFEKVFILLAPVIFIFAIGAPRLPKKPYITDEDKVVK